jgi:hypothetical protein
LKIGLTGLPQSQLPRPQLAKKTLLKRGKLLPLLLVEGQRIGQP